MGKETVPDVVGAGLSKRSHIDSTYRHEGPGVHNFYKSTSKASIDDLTIGRICSGSY